MGNLHSHQLQCGAGQQQQCGAGQQQQCSAGQQQRCAAAGMPTWRRRCSAASMASPSSMRATVASACTSPG